MEHINQFLNNWALEVVGEGVSVTNEFLPPTDKPQVTIFLHELVPTPPSHRNLIAPLQFGLRYLISAAGVNSVSEGHILLEKLVFAAMENEELELELSSPSPEFWLSLGVVMRPSFWLKAKHIRPRSHKSVPPVTEPVELRMSPTAMLYGSIVSPSGSPIIGASIGLPSDNISVMTDSSGRFRFAALPPQPNDKAIVISYKQHSIKTTISISESPVEVLFKPERS
jgi:hypothetical protein